MKKLLTAIIIILCSLPLLNAQSPAQLAAAADSAYSADNFGKAAEGYLALIKTNGPSAKLYYNLGNCYYRMNKPGDAILAYERALRLDPTDKDARFNLEFVNTRIIDRPGERGTFVGNLLDAATNIAHTNTWAWFGFGFFVLTLAGAMAYLFVGSVAVRKIGFFGGLATLLLAIVSIWFSLRAAAIAEAKDAAIVTAPSTILSTAPRTPRDRSQEAMLLHEGTKVRILDSVTSTTDSVPTLWYDVEIDNTHRAWINAKAVEVI